MTDVLQYPRLIAPKQDGELLLWPPPREMLRQTWENHRGLRDSSATLLGIPLPRLRGWMRRWMGLSEDARPLIATGHQTELYHPGVWIKNAAIDAAAHRIGALAIHFAVDTDAPKHLLYHFPGGGAPITDDPNLPGARWSGLLHEPSADHLATIRRDLAEASSSWGFRPHCDDFLQELENLAGTDIDLSTALANAHHAADRALGLRHQVVLASPLCSTTVYHLFAYAICCRADEFAAIYNAALAEFRTRHGIASPGRPMPDLVHDSESCEVPFWLDDLAAGQRQRATLLVQDGQFALHADGDAFRFETSVKDGWMAAESLGRFLSTHHLRLAPRALTLTSFLRLLVVDQFVHGIGGGLYDQVTDALLANWLGIVPPTFSVATATMYFPLAEGRERTCLECLQQENRAIRNGILGPHKMELVRQIEQAPRRSSQRALLFSQLHRELDAALRDSPELKDLQSRYEAAKARFEQDQRYFNRELPYTLQSRPRLEQIIAAVDQRFA
jgi:hypothetical protein